MEKLRNKDTILDNGDIEEENYMFEDNGDETGELGVKRSEVKPRHEQRRDEEERKSKNSNF